MKTHLPALIVLPCLFAGTVGAQTIQDLGALPGVSGSLAQSMSADGSVVFGISRTGAADLRGFRWTAPGGMQQIFTPNPADRLVPERCSDAGDKIGGWHYQPDGFISGFGWSLSGGGFYFPTRNGFPALECLGVSRFGNCYFGAISTSSNTSQAFKWTPAGGYQLLGLLPGNANESRAFDANEDGSIIVGSCYVNSVPRGFSWRASTGMVALGDMPSAGNATFATRTTRGGEVITGHGRAAGGSRPFRWTFETGLVDLGTPPGRGAAEVRALSDDGGLLLGKSWTPNVFGYQAVFWRPVAGWQDVQPFLTSIGVNFQGWSLGDVAAISTNLTVISGWGVHNGVERAYRITGIPCWSAPEIVTDGVRAVSLCRGQRLELSVLGGGSHAINVYYQWSLNGTPLADGIQPSGAVLYGSQTPTLVVDGTTPSDSGGYSCRIYNLCGGVDTRSTSVTIGSPPVYEALSAPVEVCPGGSTSISAYIFSNPPASYQWQYFHPLHGWANVPNGVFSPPFTGIFANASGANTPTLSLSGVSLGSYNPLSFRCAASNICGSANLFGIETTLSYAQPFTFFSQPADLTTCATGPANFSAYGFGSEPLVYQWETLSDATSNWVAIPNGGYSDSFSGLLFTASGANTPSLSISNVYLGAHTGPLSYRLVVLGPCNSSVSNTALHTVCPGDFNCDGGVDGDDAIAFLTLWDLGDPAADVNHDEGIDGDDVILFFGYWDSGC